MNHGRYDVVILGQEMDALVAARALAQAGKRVLLATESGDGRPRALVDSAIATGAPAVHHSGRPPAGGLPPGFGWVEASEVLVSARAASDDAPFHLARDPALAAAAVRAVSPADADAYGRFVALLERLAAATRPLVVAPPFSLVQSLAGRRIELARTAWRARSLSRADRFDLMRLLPMSLVDLLGEHFASVRLRAAIAGAALLGSNAGPWSPGGGALLLHAYLCRGWPRGEGWPRQGWPQLAAALLDQARAAGAVVEGGVSPSNLLIENDRVVGVATSSGDELRGHVLSTLSPARTCALLPPGRVPQALVADLRGLRARGTSVKVNLVLDSAPSGSAPPFRLPAGIAPALALAGHVHVGHTLEEIERAHDDCKYGRAAAHPILEAVYCPPAAGVSGARHTMSIWAHFAPYELAKGSWQQERDAFGDRVLARLEEVAPGITARVSRREVLPPPALEELHGLAGGHACGAELALDQFYSLRPTPDLATYGAPLPGLTLGSPANHPGDAVSGQAGAIAAARVLAGR